MKRIVHLVWLLAAIPAPALTQVPDRGAYDRCLIEAAVAASHDDIPGEAVFAHAQRRCAAIRASAMRDGRRDGRILAALDASDASKAAVFPDWMRALRERRRLRGIEPPIPADPGYR